LDLSFASFPPQKPSLDPRRHIPVAVSLPVTVNPGLELVIDNLFLKTPSPLSLTSEEETLPMSKSREKMETGRKGKLADLSQ